MNRAGYILTIILAALLVLGYKTGAIRVASAVATVSASAAVQDESGVKRMQKQLLGPYYDIRALTSSNIYHAYLTFMQNVQDRHSNWTDADWINARIVSERLDKKYIALYSMISISDKAQIKLLQGEFLQLYRKNVAS